MDATWQGGRNGQAVLQRGEPQVSLWMGTVNKSIIEVDTFRGSNLAMPLGKLNNFSETWLFSFISKIEI